MRDDDPQIRHAGKAPKAPPKAECGRHPSEDPAGGAKEFGERGLPAASTDDIARRCGVNKRMIYYYFGSKEGLYLAALESVFENLVALEQEIEIEHLEPPAAIEAMINLKIDYYLDNPYFISFLSMENFYKARHLRKSKKLGDVQDSVDRGDRAHPQTRRTAAGSSGRMSSRSISTSRSARSASCIFRTSTRSA